MLFRGIPNIKNNNMYDIFLVSTKNDFSNLKQLRQRFPFVRTADSIDQAKLQSLTTMFWIVWDNLAIIKSFNFNFIVPEWDHDYVHVFKNEKNKRTPLVRNKIHL